VSKLAAESYEAVEKCPDPYRKQKGYRLKTKTRAREFIRGPWTRAVYKRRARRTGAGGTPGRFRARRAWECDAAAAQSAHRNVESHGI
jgi:hypothetical protein